MLLTSVCPMVAFIAFLAVAKGAPNTRRTDPKCEVVINEVSYGSAHGSFTEIAKLCPPGVEAVKEKLGGFVLLVVDTVTLKLLFMENLHRKSLTLLPYSADADEVPVKVRHSKITFSTAKRKPHQASTTGTPSRAAPTVQPGLNFDQVTVPCELRFDCVSQHPVLKRSLRNDTKLQPLQRRKRELNEKQKNVRGLYVSKISPSIDRMKSHAVVLLKLPKKKAEVVEGRKSFILNEPLSVDAANEIKTYLHDYVLINPTKLLLDQQEVLRFIPEARPLSFIESNPDEILVSFSKCDTIISTVDPSGFAITNTPTPLEPNLCKQYQPQPFSFRGSNFNIQAKKVLANSVIGLRDYKNDPLWQKMNEVEAAATLLNVHKTTLYRVMNEYTETGKLSSPKKVERSCPVTDITDELKKVLYDSVSSFYRRNEVAYFQNVYDEFMRRVRERGGNEEQAVEYKCSTWSFAKILHKNNYRYGRINERDAVLFRSYSVERRKRYLTQIAEYDADKDVDVYYQDETWIDPYSRNKKGWVLKTFASVQERKDFTFADAKVSRGPRLIILAIGGKNGFIPGTTEVYMVSKSKVQQDYHGNINGPKFEQWILKVLDKLTRKSVFVIDNSPVHSVTTAPTSNQGKDVFLSWLDQKFKAKTLGFSHIPPDYARMNKPELWAIIKKIKEEVPQYKIDDIIRERGHVALRLPPYQADLNPIEFVWNDVKREVKTRNTEQNAKKSLEIAKEVLDRYTAQQWTKHIQHVKKLEQEYKEGDAAYERLTREDPTIEEQFIDVEPVGEEDMEEEEEQGVC